MKKYTRRHYNKKLIAFGLATFMGIGLVSTGFAAWVVSKDSKVEEEDNVTVSTITDVNMEIVVTEKTGDFVFGAKEGDEEGRIYSDGQDEESLSVTIKGTVRNAEAMTSLTIQLTTLPEGVAAACTEGYLVAPECYASPIELINLPTTTETESEGTMIVSFEYTISFAWGEKFGGENPSIYYDGAGATIEDAVMFEELKKFRTMLINEKTEAGDLDLNKFNELVDDLKYVVTIKATAKAQAQAQG